MKHNCAMCFRQKPPTSYLIIGLAVPRVVKMSANFIYYYNFRTFTKVSKKLFFLIFGFSKKYFIF